MQMKRGLKSGQLHSNCHCSGKLRLKREYLCPVYESVSPGEHFKYVNMTTLLSVLKKAKNDTFSRKKIGATGLKLGMHTQLNSGINMGWGPPGHTSSSWGVRLNCKKWYF